MTATKVIGAGSRFRSQLFTTVGAFSFLVPGDVECLYVDGSGGGGGGGGGHNAPGGGGGGGAAAACIKRFMVAVTPSSTLTIGIGAAGLGGAANTNGTSGGDSTIDGLLDTYSSVTGQLILCKGGPGLSGANPNGGSGGNTEFATLNALTAGGVGGAGAGATSFPCSDALATVYGCLFTGGAAGGALNNSGGTLGVTSPFRGIGFGTGGGAAGGGGGKGGMGIFGLNGNGGNNGGVGTAATGYGCGGGGGSGNAIGGNGSPGFFRFYWEE